MQIEKEQEEGCQIDVHSVSPSDIKDMLLNILVQNLYELDFKTPLQQRQIDGALNRVPKDFYDRVWEILEKTPNGIKVAGYHLPQVNSHGQILVKNGRKDKCLACSDNFFYFSLTCVIYFRTVVLTSSIFRPVKTLEPILEYYYFFLAKFNAHI